MRRIRQPGGCDASCAAATERSRENRMTDPIRRALLLSMAGTALGARGETAASPSYRVVFDFPWGAHPSYAMLSEGVLKGTAAGLERLGYVEGRNLALATWRRVRDPEALGRQLAQLRARPPHAIVVGLATNAVAWRARMPSTPIVAWAVIDPVAAGLADTFVRPGRNITGLTQSTEEVAGELVDILREFVPGISSVTIFFSLPPGPRPATVPPGAAGEDYRELEYLEVAARRAGLRVRTIPSSGREALEALRTMRREGYEAAIYGTQPRPVAPETMRLHAEAAIDHGVPTICLAYEHLAVNGLLAAYGELEGEFHLRLAQQLARVLALGDASNLPFIAPSRFHLVINTRTAQRLGLRVPPGLQIAADRLVQ